MKRLEVRLDDKAHEHLKSAAKASHRSIHGEILSAITEHLKGDAPMAAKPTLDEIRAELDFAAYDESARETEIGFAVRVGEIKLTGDGADTHATTAVDLDDMRDEIAKAEPKDLVVDVCYHIVRWPDGRPSAIEYGWTPLDPPANN